MYGSYPQIMGILNVTPDSFSDGGQHFSLEAALRQTEKMLQEGAAIIDVGGESARPGALPIARQAELDRVIPVIEKIKNTFDCVISIDTRHALVMQAAVQAGAHMINDITALREEGSLQMAAKLQVPVCLMHMQGQPNTMQHAPHYHDVVAEIMQFFVERIDLCVTHGIAREKIIIDPGFGFGKTLQHNLTLLKELHCFKTLGAPLLVGLSRKTMFGEMLQKPASERVYGSLAAAALALRQGADIIRVHDVAATKDVLTVIHAINTVE
jgi:dihydropteroate synthase